MAASYLNRSNRKDSQKHKQSPKLVGILVLVSFECKVGRRLYSTKCEVADKKPIPRQVAVKESTSSVYSLFGSCRQKYGRQIEAYIMKEIKKKIENVEDGWRVHITLERHCVQTVIFHAGG